MPDFNFAKGNSKRDEHTSGASEASNAAGQARQPVRSVLDKYPQRDLSRLAGQDPASASGERDSVPPSSGGQPTQSSSVPPPTAGDTTSDAASDGGASDSTHGSNTGVEEGSMAGRSGKGPLVAILSVVGLLVIVAFIWHVNPWPGLKDALAGLFTSKTPAPTEVASGPAATVAEEDAVPMMRSWDFFIQVSSWKELAKADLDAERFRAQGYGVIVESEFIPAKGGTWYRVRLGPFESSDDARAMLAKSAGILPSGAYVDSIRLTDDLPLAAAPPAASTSSPGVPSTGKTAAAQKPGRSAARLPGRDFEVVDEPMSGYAVKVSSLKSVDIARDEARKLLQQGYPSFITRKYIGGTVWYRVLVGPFNDKRDADKYQQLLNVTYGNDAYTVNLAAD